MSFLRIKEKQLSPVYEDTVYRVLESHQGHCLLMDLDRIRNVLVKLEAI